MYRFVTAVIIIAAGTAQGQGVVDAYGDSLTSDTTEGFMYKWCGLRTSPEIDCIPVGIPGETYADGVDQYLDDLDAGVVRDGFVVLAWGANDLRRGGWDADTQIFEPLVDAIEATLESGRMPVAWIPNPQFVVGTTEIYDLVDDRITEIVSPGIKDIASEYRIPVIDTYTLFIELREDLPDYYRDHVHPDFIGSDLIAEEVVPEPTLASSLFIGLIALAAAARRRA